MAIAAVSMLLATAACSSGSDAASTKTTTSTSSGTDATTTTTAAAASATCDTALATFRDVTSANADLPAPQLSATCTDGKVTVQTNAIPDYTYVATTPGTLTEHDATFSFPVEPTVATTPGEVPRVGPIGVAVDGVPIFGPTEATGGDVTSLNDALMSGLVCADDACREALQLTSSWQLTDESLFASDTWAAHSYVEGSGDLDQCNGRVDDDGQYRYYTTTSFPYYLGCYRGDLLDDSGAGGPGGGMGPPPGA